MTTVVVAPREIVDLVFRASRVRGCDASVAERVATSIAYCEGQYGGGLAAWAEIVSGPRPLVEAAAASFTVDLAIVDTLRNQRGRVEWDPPIPAAFIAEAIADAQRRGLSWRDHPPRITGTTPIDAVEFVPATGADAPDPPAREQTVAHLSNGIAINASLWTSISRQADAFLLSEAVLDAADREQ